MSEDRKVDICGGVDTHRDVHVAAVVDTAGRVLGSAPFIADTAGYEKLGDWLQSHGSVVRVGVEGTGSYGAGLARHLTRAGVEVVEVTVPTGSCAAPEAKPTSWTLRTPPGLLSVGRPPPNPKAATDQSKRSECWGWSAVRRSKPAPRPSTNYTPS